jgi:hypothetical protein
VDVEPHRDGEQLTVEVPAFDTWGLLVIDR